jgi:hypothetical protein
MALSCKFQAIPRDHIGEYSISATGTPSARAICAHYIHIFTTEYTELNE